MILICAGFGSFDLPLRLFNDFQMKSYLYKTATSLIADHWRAQRHERNWREALVSQKHLQQLRGLLINREEVVFIKPDVDYFTKLAAISLVTNVDLLQMVTNKVELLS